MKIKSKWIEYIINRHKDVWGEDVIILVWISSSLPDVRNWHGKITEEEVKKLLSRKQFNEWKQGKRNSFIKHLTLEERKAILKRNNKKKNDGT
jgi:hypothetical protein